MKYVSVRKVNKKKRGKMMECEEMLEDLDRVIPPDGGWGWVVLTATVLCNILSEGLYFSFNLIICQLIQRGERSVTTLASIVSLSGGFAILARPLAVHLIDKFGFQAVKSVLISGCLISSIALAVSSTVNSASFLFATIGILAGLGYGLVSASSLTAINFYFESKKKIARDLVINLSPLGGALVGPITAYLIETYTWRGAFLIQSAIYVHCVALGLLFRPLESIRMRRKRANAEVPSTNGTPLMERIKRDRDRKLHADSLDPIEEEPVVESDSSSLASVYFSLEEVGSSTSPGNQPESVIPSTEFSFPTVTIETSCEPEKPQWSYKLVLVGLSTFFASLGYFIPFTFIPIQAQDMQHSAQFVALLVVLIGVTNCIGRFVYVWIINHSEVSLLLVNNVALTVCGIITINPFFNSYNLIILYSILFGFTIACVSSTRPLLLHQLIGQDHLKYPLLFHALPIAIGNSLAGFLYDLTGDVSSSFYLAGSAIVISTLFLYPFRCVGPDKNYNTQQT